MKNPSKTINNSILELIETASAKIADYSRNCSEEEPDKVIKTTQNAVKLGYDILKFENERNKSYEKKGLRSPLLEKYGIEYLEDIRKFLKLVDSGKIKSRSV